MGAGGTINADAKEIAPVLCSVVDAACLQIYRLGVRAACAAVCLRGVSDYRISCAAAASPERFRLTRVLGLYCSNAPMSLPLLSVVCIEFGGF